MKDDEKKLDNLIKIGVGLILISIIVFATTNWNILGSISKLLILFILLCVFYGLSIFTKKVLHLDKSSFMYYILSSLMVVTLLIGIGYYKLFGEFYSFFGDGYLILLSNIFLLSGLILYSYNKRINNKWFIIGGFNFLIVSVILFQYHFISDFTSNLFLISVYLSIIKLLCGNKLSSYYNLNIKIVHYLCYLLFIILYSDFNILYLIEGSLFLCLISYLYLFYDKKDNNIDFSCFPACLFFLIFKSFYVIEVESSLIIMSVLSIIFLLLYVLGIKIIKHKYFSISSCIIHNFVLFIYIFSFLNNELNYIYLIILFISLLVDYMFINEYLFEEYICYIKSCVLSVCLVYYMNLDFIDIRFSVFSILSLALYYVFNNYFKNKCLSLSSFIIHNSVMFFGFIYFISSKLNNIYLIMLLGSYILNGLNSNINERDKYSSYVKSCVLAICLIKYITLSDHININYVIISGILISLFIIFKVVFENKSLFITSYYMYVSLLFIFSAYFLLGELNFIYLIILLLSVFISYLFANDNKYENYIRLFEITVLLICFTNFIGLYDYIIPILLLGYCIFTYICKNDTFGKFVYVMFNSIIFIGILKLGMSDINNVTYFTYMILPLFCCLSLYITKNKYNDYKKYIIVFYYICFALLFTVNSSLLKFITEDSNMIHIIASLVLMIGFSFGYLLYKDDKFSYQVSLYYVFIPIIMFFSIFDSYLLRIVISFYIAFLGFAFKYKFNSTYDYLHIISLIILFTFKLSFVTVSLWLLCVIYLFVSYSNNEYKTVAKTSLVFLVLSIIINLINFWKLIPFYVYLFVLGIAIVFFVTKKEYFKNNNKLDNKEVIKEKKEDVKIVNKIEKKEEEVVEKGSCCDECKCKLNGNETFCPKCGHKVK